jgi:hypothetical protein
MIKYALQCDKAHPFESWFPSINSYDSQAKRGLLECPMCGSVKIEKQIMSPTVRLAGFRKDEPVADVSTAVVADQNNTAAETVSGPNSSPEAPSKAMLIEESDAAQKLRVMIREIHDHVKANTEDVGTKFADEARKIHYGEAEERGIRGKASAEEAEALAEEGIGFLPLPILPDDRN